MGFRGHARTFLGLLCAASTLQHTTPFSPNSALSRVFAAGRHVGQQHQAVFCDMDQAQREYNLNVGKAIDVLRNDVPHTLSQVSTRRRPTDRPTDRPTVFVSCPIFARARADA